MDLHGGRDDIFPQQGCQGQDVGAVHDYLLVDLESEVQARFREQVAESKLDCPGDHKGSWRTNTTDRWRDEEDKSGRNLCVEPTGGGLY